MKELFGTLSNVKKYACCVLVLVPNYFVTGILLTLAPEVAKATHTQGTIKVNIALALYFTASVLGDLLGAWLSEIFKSRRLVAALFIVGNILLASVLIRAVDLSTTQFYAICATLGLCNLWAMSSTIVVEQLPTQLRSLASTASLNLSRGGVIVMNFFLLTFRPFGITNVLLVIGCTVAFLGLVSTWRLAESYDRSLVDVRE